MAEINLSLIIFTLCIGLCAGTFTYFALWQMNNGLSGTQQKLAFKVMCVLLICLAIAMLASATHLGKPMRFLNAFRNPGSMIAQEGLWSIGLGIILLVSVFLAYGGKKIPKLVYVLGGLVSFGLIFVCSMVYVKATGYPAWSSGATIVYYFGSAILLGAAGMYLISAQINDNTAIKKMSLVALVALFFQVIATVAFTIHLRFGVVDVVLPATIGIEILRWLVGLIAPAIIAYLTWTGKFAGKNAAWSFLACVLAGEIISRFIFFLQGVHL